MDSVHAYKDVVFFMKKILSVHKLYLQGHAWFIHLSDSQPRESLEEAIAVALRGLDSKSLVWK